MCVDTIIADQRPQRQTPIMDRLPSFWWVPAPRGLPGATAFLGLVTVEPLPRDAGAVQDRAAREGLKARYEYRRSGLRSAHHFAASLGEKLPLTRRRAVIPRCHCQQAASNDARVCPALRLGKGTSARAQGGDRGRRPCAGAQSYWPARCRASAGDHRRRSSRATMRQRVHAHHELGELRRAPSWGHALRFKIG
jgi:hypothetical protein